MLVDDGISLAVFATELVVEPTVLVTALVEGVAGADGAVPFTLEETLPVAVPLVSPDTAPLVSVAADPDFLTLVVSSVGVVIGMPCVALPTAPVAPPIAPPSCADAG